MTTKDEKVKQELMLTEIKEICDKAVEGLCPEGHFGLIKCPYPDSEYDDARMCGKCYMDLILAKAEPLIRKDERERMAVGAKGVITPMVYEFVHRGKAHLDFEEMPIKYRRPYYDLAHRILQALKEEGK